MHKQCIPRSFNETISSPPNGTVVNNDACQVNNATIFPNNSWVVYEDGADTFAAAILVKSSRLAADDWLITPAIDLSAATGSIALNWKAQSFEGSASGFPKVMKYCYLPLERYPADFTTTLFSIAQEKMTGQVALLI